jgi:hypothetical protein
MEQLNFELARARRETPGCATVMHFNNAGAALMPQPVLEAVVGHLQLEAAIGGYEAKKRETERVERVYKAAASLINCTPEEIAFIENQAIAFLPRNPNTAVTTSLIFRWLRRQELWLKSFPTMSMGKHPSTHYAT